jgi:hypothetical protein
MKNILVWPWSQCASNLDPSLDGADLGVVRSRREMRACECLVVVCWQEKEEEESR